MPIAAVISPAALTVVPMETKNFSMLYVPNLNFRSFNFLAVMPPEWGTNYKGRSLSYFGYTGPSQIVEQLATVVGVGGSKLAITPPEPNATWTLDFVGPSLRCDTVTGGLQHAIEKNVHASTYQCEQAYGYVSWSPAMNNALPFRNGPNSLSNEPLNPRQSKTYRQASSNSFEPTIVTNGSAPATLYVAIFPGAANLVKSWDGGLRRCRDAYTQSHIVQCSLYNSSRSIRVEYVNGIQYISFQNYTVFRNEPIPALGGVYGPNDVYKKSRIKNCSTLNTSGEPCTFDVATARNLAYQAIMQNFGQLIKGSIRWKFSNYKGGSSSASVSPFSIVTVTVLTSAATTILPKTFGIELEGIMDRTMLSSTPLLGLRDLQFLRQWMAKAGYYPSLRETSEMQQPFIVDGTYNSTLPASRLSFNEALERLFDNITISMMSSPILQ